MANRMMPLVATSAIPRTLKNRRARVFRYSLGLLAAAALVGVATSVASPGPQTPAFVSAPGAGGGAADGGRGGIASRSDGGQAATAAAAAAALALPAQEAWAKGGQWGPLEGKVSSLVHPLIMPLFFLTMLYSGFLGWQWRRTRLIAGDISALKKQLPKEEDPEEPLSAAQKAIKAQLQELTAERADLVKGQFKDRHYQLSAGILGGGIFFTVFGVFNTWFRTEKLFPGPHLFAGAAVCVLWALAAALVPYMEKGNETARTAHIGLNVVNLGLFAWQLPTGFEILQKVWGNANLPWF
mmetsp:Transcript_94151/g.265876  ORF Transcript_94151/g.265876 Transcript_94151/m.265876 type:complete len:297 (+) Transcript_94151:55-945(+)